MSGTVAMSHWVFWEWVAYTALFISAAIVAADTGFRSAPAVKKRLPKSFHSAWWGRTPLVLIAIATIILLAQQLGFLGKDETQSTVTPLQASINARDKWKLYSPNRIVGKQFYNQEVFLDGNEYTDCEFHNVTFVYDGNTPIRLLSPKIYDKFIFKTNNPSVENSWQLLIATGTMPNVEIYGPLKDRIPKPTIVQPK